VRKRVARLSDLEDGAARCVEVDGERVALVRIGGEVYALADTCSHAEASLSEGWVYAEEREIECPRHGAPFSLTTGEPGAPPATRPVAVYPVTIEDGDVYVEAPA